MRTGRKDSRNSIRNLKIISQTKRNKARGEIQRLVLFIFLIAERSNQVSILVKNQHERRC